MRRAARTDATQAAIVAALRKIGCEVQDLSRMGNGVPDLMAKLRFRIMWLEVKSPGGKLTPHQVDWHLRWSPHVAVVTTPEEAIEVMIR